MRRPVPMDDDHSQPLAEDASMVSSNSSNKSCWLSVNTSIQQMLALA